MSVVYWITGFSGAGKTTLANQLAGHIRDQDKKVFLLDGDEMRSILPGTFGYNIEDRISIASFYGKLACSIASQGVDVVCATISMFHEIRAWNRDNIDNYFEIFLDVPIEELQRRNNKNIYELKSNAYEKNVMGVTLTAELPLNPDVHIRWAPGLKPNHVFNHILKELSL